VAPLTGCPWVSVRWGIVESSEIRQSLRLRRGRRQSSSRRKQSVAALPCASHVRPQCTRPAALVGWDPA